MVRKFSEDIIGDDDHDVDAFAAWLTAIVGMYGIGYPIGHTAVIGWFSKAMKSRPQGMLMGLFASAGSVARIVFPICSGVASDLWGPDVVFACLAALLGATLVILVVKRRAFREAIA
jgi:ceroid-lipofuscinosis MFS transporter 7